MGGHYRQRFKDIKTCKACGGAFAASRKDARYCSAACRQAVSRHLRRELAADEMRRQLRSVTRDEPTSQITYLAGQAELPPGTIIVTDK